MPAVYLREHVRNTAILHLEGFYRWDDQDQWAARMHHSIADFMIPYEDVDGDWRLGRDIGGTDTEREGIRASYGQSGRPFQTMSPSVASYSPFWHLIYIGDPPDRMRQTAITMHEYIESDVENPTRGAVLSGLLFDAVYNNR